MTAVVATETESSGDVTVRVFRWAPGESEHTQQYRVGVGPSTTVLDCLVEAQRELDPSLAFRYACRVGMCGSCAMVINGRERWACRTLVRSLAAEAITIRPLYHFPLIRDLVVDMRPFVEKMRSVGGAFVAPALETRARRPERTAPARWPAPASAGPAESAQAAPSAGLAEAEYARRRADSRERREIERAIECIGCGMCVSACTMVAHHARFPGPAALNRAFTLQWDDRDRGQGARWKALLSDDGLARCHGQANCTEVCPMGLEPSTSIIRLRRRGAWRLLDAPRRAPP